MIKDIMNEFAKGIKRIFGQKLSKIIIYGSYARGDYTENSDIDVMIFCR